MVSHTLSPFKEHKEQNGITIDTHWPNRDLQTQKLLEYEVALPRLVYVVDDTDAENPSMSIF